MVYLAYRNSNWNAFLLPRIGNPGCILVVWGACLYCRPCSFERAAGRCVFRCDSTCARARDGEFGNMLM